MLKKIYKWLYRVTARPDEKGEIFGGRWQGMIREAALQACGGARGKALEIGCGNGLFLLKLASREPGLEVWGIDKDETLMRKAELNAAERKTANVRFAAEDAAKLSFADGTFDRVICINFFIDTGFGVMADILKEMKRVCKDSGRLVFEFRSSRNILFVLKYRLAKYYDDTAPYPLHTFDPDRVDDLLGGLGLKIIRRLPLGFPVKWFAPIILIEAGKT